MGHLLPLVVLGLILLFQCLPTCSILLDAISFESPQDSMISEGHAAPVQALRLGGKRRSQSTHSTISTPIFLPILTLLWFDL